MKVNFFVQEVLEWVDGLKCLSTSREFTVKGKPSCFPLTLFSHQSCRKLDEERYPSCSSSCNGKPLLLLNHGFFLASFVWDINWEISCRLTCPSQRLQLIREELLLLEKIMIRVVNVSVAPLNSHTCAGFVALLPPARKTGRDRHTRTLLACLLAWLVFSGKV